MSPGIRWCNPNCDWQPPSLNLKSVSVFGAKKRYLFCQREKYKSVDHHKICSVSPALAQSFSPRCIIPFDLLTHNPLTVFSSAVLCSLVSPSSHFVVLLFSSWLYVLSSLFSLFLYCLYVTVRIVFCKTTLFLCFETNQVNINYNCARVWFYNTGIWACDGKDTRVQILNGAESNLITTRRLTGVGSRYWFLVQIISVFSPRSVVESVPGRPDVVFRLSTDWC